MENGVVRVQHKHFSRDAWGPAEGHLCLQSLPSTTEKPDLAEVFPADSRELRALEDFIVYKESCVQRHIHIEENLVAIGRTEQFIEYLKEFPTSDRSAEKEQPFWPSTTEGNEGENVQVNAPNDGRDEVNMMSAEVQSIMATMPNPEARGYFGPRRNKPAQVSGTRAPRRRRTNEGTETVATTRAEVEEDPFPMFEPQEDLQVGQFVALSVEATELRAGVPFYVGKILEFGQRSWASKVKVLWYWPILRARGGRGKSSSADRYANCMEALWEPSGERHGWVEKEAAIFSWNDIPRRSRNGSVTVNNVPVHGELTEKEISIPALAKPHLLEYIAMQVEELDNERLQNDINAY